MNESEFNGSPQVILERISEYFKESSFTNTECDGFKYRVSKFSFDADTGVTMIELITKDNKKPIKRFIYKLIILDK